jgi:hypothetical protein
LSGGDGGALLNGDIGGVGQAETGLGDCL